MPHLIHRSDPFLAPQEIYRLPASFFSAKDMPLKNLNARQVVTENPIMLLPLEKYPHFLVQNIDLHLNYPIQDIANKLLNVSR